MLLNYSTCVACNFERLLSKLCSQNIKEWRKKHLLYSSVHINLSIKIQNGSCKQPKNLIHAGKWVQIPQVYLRTHLFMSTYTIYYNVVMNIYIVKQYKNMR